MSEHISRMQRTFTILHESNKKALVPFITAGDPHGISVANIMHALVAGGANIIELGVPFSDPAADGETIQHASERAIAHGVNARDVLAAVREFRQTNSETPVVLMGYLNTAEVFEGGFAGFSTAVSQAGVDAVIIVDLSYESGVEYRKTLRAAGVDLITLVAPTTSKTRLGKMVKSAHGFVYYVSMRGVTGNSSSDQGLNTDEISLAVKQIRSKTDLPVCVGFGIKDGETARSVAEYANGVVVGSALVKLLHETHQNNEDVLGAARHYMAALRTALDEK